MFTPWTLLVDVGMVSLLLLAGKILRARLRFIQRFFLPPSLLAGFAALILGPEILDWIPLSDQTGTYAGVLIALVFGCLPLTSGDRRKETAAGTGRMWAYSQAGMLLQWGLGAGLGLLLALSFPKVSASFGLAMPAGFCGGHGTAAAIGEAFGKYGEDAMLSLSMTAATVGIVASVVLGMWMINRGAEKGRTSYLTRFSDLPPELRTGILPKEKRVSMGSAAFSAISLDSLTFNIAIIALIALCGYGISKAVAHFWPVLQLPVFSCAFLAGLPISALLKKAGAEQYLSKPIIGHLSGAFTDYLVVFGIASIKLQVVVRFIVPLLIMLTVGLVLTALYVFVAGRKMHREAWFEKSVFTWGWFTGTMAMGIALLRITDPEGKSHCLDEYAMAYLYIAPVEIALVSLSPILFTGGYGLWFTLFCLLSGTAILCFYPHTTYSRPRSND